jgi:serine/threonine protein kinase
MLNSVIKDYHIQRELGRGGMATVYLAHDQKFDTNVAIKVLNKEFAYNENIRKRFVSEAKSMFKMSHPNIIKVTDLIDEGDTVAFVMEYIEGETLKEYLDRKGRLKDDEIKDIFSQMLSAVGYVHKHNLVHRDIKPSNFMMDRSGNIKLLDFGIAKNTNALSAEYTQTGTGAQMGTPMYMSPEQITEPKSVTAQSDIYSLGAVLWQMVTGQKPYDTKTLSDYQLLDKIVKEALPFTRTPWDAVISKATVKSVTDRYNVCRSFYDSVSDLTFEDGASGSAINGSSKEDDTTIIEGDSPTENIINALGIEFIWVEGGSFIVGSKDGAKNERPLHEAVVDSFYLSKYPITQSQWKAIMNSNPSRFKTNGADCPVENVSWYDCEKFIEKLNNQGQYAYRLPSESEWEYAARGGLKSKGYVYSGSNAINDVAWYADNSHREREPGILGFFSLKTGTQIVGKKQSNELGIFDMTGNVWEWCSDWYGGYSTLACTNPRGASSGQYRVIRGGSWNSLPRHCRVSVRFRNVPGARNSGLGFRLVLVSDRGTR